MILAYQLVSHGVPVRVLERHPDFRREFRGELIHASVLAPLDRLGILGTLRERGLTTADVQRRMFVGATREVGVPGSNVRGTVISQEGMLELLHELCSAYPHYRLDFGTAAYDLEKDGGRLRGVKVRRGSVEDVVAAELVVVCSGRNSVLRKAAGLEVEPFHVADLLPPISARTAPKIGRSRSGWQFPVLPAATRRSGLWIIACSSRPPDLCAGPRRQTCPRCRCNDPDRGHKSQATGRATCLAGWRRVRATDP